MSPRYKGYYTIAQENGLISDETLESIGNTPITRQKLATWLFVAFELQNDSDLDTDTDSDENEDESEDDSDDRDDDEDESEDDWEDEYDDEDEYEDDWEDEYDDDDGRESDRDDDDDGEWDNDEIIVYETEVDSEEDCSELEEYDAQQ